MAGAVGPGHQHGNGQAYAAEHFPAAPEHATFQLEPPGHAGHEHETPA